MKKLITLLLIVACSLMISQCSNMSPSQATATDNKSVSVSFVIQTNEQFRHCAKRAILSVSAFDFDTIRQPMIITDSVLKGTVSGIPVGDQRKFEIHVYDSSNNLSYYGLQVASLQSEVTTKVSIPLGKVSGPVEVIGHIVDDTTHHDTTHYDTTHYYDTTRGNSGRIVGGNCTYDSIIGKAVVTKIVKIESITESPYYVYFTFSSGTIEKEGRIVIPPSRVSKVVIGKEYAAKLFNKKQGTCTPEFYEILEIQRSIVDSLYDYDTTHYDTTHYYDTTRGDSGRIVGGNCTYDSIIGKAVVTKIVKIESITESPYYVYFTFSSGTIEKEDRIVIPPSRVSRVVIGKEYAAKLFNKKQGTCTPEFYEILEIQRSDENVN